MSAGSSHVYGLDRPDDGGGHDNFRFGFPHRTYYGSPVDHPMKIYRKLFSVPNNPIKDDIIKKNGEAYKKREYLASVGVISSKKLVCDLIALGCVQRKSLVLEFPVLHDDLLKHFIRGYFDGDGCICLSKKFLRAVQLTLIAQCDLNPTKIGKRNKIHQLTYGGRLNVLKISTFLYEGATAWLDRKRTKMEMSKNG